jgi:tRNA(Ile)-lysidine synthase
VTRAEQLVRAAGLLTRARVLVLLSGGRDSVCLLDLAARLADEVAALHVDYGLRPSSRADAEHCAALCARLGVPLTVHRAGRPTGNLQAWAREVRYRQAERRAGAGVLVAVGHTASDQVETVLYRLAASPGRRALLGMAAREGRVIRPLLEVTREETAAHCAERGLPWREDPSNASPDFARNRARHELLPALRGLHPAAEANVLRTLEVLRDEAAVLDAVVDEALAAAIVGAPQAGAGGAGAPGRGAAAPGGGAAARGGGAAAAAAGAADLARLAALPPALARLALQRLADRAAGGAAPAIGARAEELLALGARGGWARLDLGRGLRAVAEYGRLRFEVAGDEDPPPAATVLHLPGRVAFGGGELAGEVGPSLPVQDGTLDLDAIAAPLEVRPWREGDRMRPLGLGGSRSLQDLFTDRRVPRARRRALPVVVSHGEIVWVPGVATGERFRVTAATRRRARLAWRPAPTGRP